MNLQSWTQHLPFEKATIAKRTIPKIQAFLGTSVQNVSYHVINILKDKGLDENSVIKNYLITASDGKKNIVVCYSLEIYHGRGRDGL